MTSSDVLKGIVSNGSNLVLYRPLTEDSIRELAKIAKATGAHLTITTELSSEFIQELASTYGSSITFVEGLFRFEKEK